MEKEIKIKTKQILIICASETDVGLPRAYEESITVKKLKDFIKDFPDDTKVIIDTKFFTPYNYGIITSDSLEREILL